MSGSSFGKLFRITTWGESHGAGIGVVIDGCPAGLSLSEDVIQVFLDRRRPGQSKYTTKRSESDTVEILSGVFEGKTTGTPISLLVRNQDQRSRDYGNIAHTFRPGHADYGFFEKYGIRDYRGGGRSSGRETIGRVAAGAIASLLLKELGITLCTYTRSIGPVSIQRFDMEEIENNHLKMPDAEAAKKAAAWLEKCMSEKNSSGGIIECVVHGMPAGAGKLQVQDDAVGVGGQDILRHLRERRARKHFVALQPKQPRQLSAQRRVVLHHEDARHAPSFPRRASAPPSSPAPRRAPSRAGRGIASRPS